MKRPSKIWDALIIGGGPAGLAAGIHLARARYRTLLLERGDIGGQARLLGRIENFPGYRSGIPGAELMRRWEGQARRWGLNFRRGKAGSPRRKASLFETPVSRGKTVASKTVVFCGGVPFKRLGVPGEARLSGRGVHHGVRDESAGPAEQDAVAVVGGGEAAVQQAAALSFRGGRVYLVTRGERLKAHPLLLARLARRRNVERLRGMAPARIVGRSSVSGVELRPRAGGQGVTLDVSGVHVLIGKERPAPPFAGARPPGFFVAGDASGGPFRQVAIAAGEGVRAAMRCCRHLQREARR